MKKPKVTRARLKQPARRFSPSATCCAFERRYQGRRLAMLRACYSRALLSTATIAIQTVEEWSAVRTACARRRRGDHRLHPAQHCEDVLNICRVEKFESTKLHERHVATDYLKRSTMI